MCYERYGSTVTSLVRSRRETGRQASATRASHTVPPGINSSKPIVSNLFKAMRSYNKVLAEIRNLPFYEFKRFGKSTAFEYGFHRSKLQRPNVVATLSRLGVPAVTETVIPNTMLPTSMIPNIPCGSTYRFVPSCSTNMPTIDTLIPSNVNVIQTRLPVAEPVISNGNIVPNSIPTYSGNGLPVAETIPNVAPCTTVIQDSI
ncbi:hypothetical protein EVAR_100966_1 [Eumeta japonica]|uniref:Uncharacterized protein n=1 Tax=Eumeta variegata TaxID=151549 RepID=A0A4C2ADR8_EUMVA|nr:hypothetical protein EVAR_100966_1 [Eumeta japonica]